MRNSRPAHTTTVRADEVKIGDRVSRRSYIREVLAVDRDESDVVLTIDRGWDETVTETYAAGDEIELWHEGARA